MGFGERGEAFLLTVLWVRYISQGVASSDPRKSQSYTNAADAYYPPPPPLPPPSPDRFFKVRNASLTFPPD